VERYRITSETSVYYITFSVVDWLPVFVSTPAFEVIANSLSFSHERKGLRINAYLVMPTHMHAVVFDADFDSTRLKLSLDEFRRFTGRQLADLIDERFPPCFQSTIRAASGDDRERRVWQPSRHPVSITGERFWQQKVDYLHENPCRKGLVRRAVDWKYSSAEWWYSDGSVATDVPLTALEW
jgi:putative transposase